MHMTFWDHANPTAFMRLSGAVLPWVSGAAGVCLCTGLTWGLMLTPPAQGFGASVKVIYVHVPAAMMAINLWLMMVLASGLWFVRRHHVSALAAKAAAPVGLTMTLIALVTGALWGEPVWGTWWAWDPRLTAFLILFLSYLGYVALWRAVPHTEAAADLAALLCLVGSVFALVSRYAVLFWAQGLHQGATLSLDRAEHIANVYWVPLVVTIAGFVALSVALVLARTRTEIRRRRIDFLQERARRA